MARLATVQDNKPVDIKTFLGLNIEPTGDTQILKGESGNMTNFYITKNYKISKIEGYTALFKSIGNYSIQNKWYGNLNGTYHFIFACNGHIYELDKDYFDDPTAWETDSAFSTYCTDLGTLTDGHVEFFQFGDKVYMLNGAEYKYWTGTGNIADVAGYIPKIKISTTPAGSGTEYELLNLLTGKKHMTFNGDNSATVYHLAETSIGSVDHVYVGGVEKTLTTHYTVDLTAGTVTFTAGNTPPTGLDNVDIYWTKGTGTRNDVILNKYVRLFGVATDTRAFLYGNSSAKNRVIYSELADGVPSVEYFTSASYRDIGNSGYAVTDMQRQYDRLQIYTNKPEAYYSYYESVNIDGVDTASFPVFPLNENRGNVAFGQGQVLNNDPFTIDYELVRWTSTNVRDERNAVGVSKRIQPDLDDLNLANCKTVDWQERGELWISNGTKVFIYNYQLINPTTGELGVFSRLTLAHTPTCFLVINGDLYFGTTTGQIMKLSEDYLTFNGTTINAHWESNFLNFGRDDLTKSMNKMWLTFQPQLNVSADIGFITDKDSSNTRKQTISYKTSVFELGSVDFSDFSFAVSIDPQVKQLRINAKKFNYLKITIDNESATETCVILGLNLKAEYGSESR